MRNLAEEAGMFALDEQADGRQMVMILMPHNWGAIAFDMGPWPRGILPRFSNRHADLGSSPIETLIVVGREHDIDGFLLARESLRGQLQPRIVLITPGDGLVSVSYNGHECFEEAVVQGVRDLDDPQWKTF